MPTVFIKRDETLQSTARVAIPANHRCTARKGRGCHGSLQGGGMRLVIVPVTFRQACAFIEAYHRHHRPPQGMKFAIGTWMTGALSRSLARVPVACPTRTRCCTALCGVRIGRWAISGWSAIPRRVNPGRVCGPRGCCRSLDSAHDRGGTRQVGLGSRMGSTRLSGRAGRSGLVGATVCRVNPSWPPRRRFRRWGECVVVQLVSVVQLGWTGI
jgi:hypothetical protein